MTDFTPEFIQQQRALAEKVKSLPWSACNDGECSCKQISCDDYPIAEVTHGDWGDDYPSIRLIGGSLDIKAEPYMEQITYGNIPEETATNHARYIVAAANNYPAALDHIAYQAAQIVEISQMVSDYQADLKDRDAEIATLRKQAEAGAMLAETLLIYADEGNWSSTAVEDGELDDGWDGPGSEYHVECELEEHYLWEYGDHEEGPVLANKALDAWDEAKGGEG